MPYNAGSAIQRVTLVNAATDTDVTPSAGTAADPNVVVGAAAHDAAVSGAPILQGGVAGSSAPTAVSVGDAVRSWHGLNGQQVVAVGAAFTGTDAAANTLVYPQNSSTSFNHMLAVGGFRFNGTSWDRDRKPNVSKRIASSAASGNPDFLKASAGELVQFWGQNGAAITYIQFYNKASAPTIGTDTPILTRAVAANAAFDVSIPNGGLYFATGIAYAFTTDAAGTTGASAAAVTSCNIIGA